MNVHPMNDSVSNNVFHNTERSKSRNLSSLDMQENTGDLSSMVRFSSKDSSGSDPTIEQAWSSTSLSSTSSFGNDGIPSVAYGNRKRTKTRKSAWSKMEDDFVVSIASNVGSSKPNWCKIARLVNDQSHAGRTGKQCRERYLNHLRPNIKKGGWTKEEETMIRYYHKMFGKKWSAMAQIMKNRTDNDIKNKFYSMNRSDKRKQERSPKTETFETSFQSNGQSGDAQCQPSLDQEKLVFDFIPAFELPSLQMTSLQRTEPLFAGDSLLYGMHSSIMNSNSVTPQPHQYHGGTAGNPYDAMDWQGYPPGPEPIHVWGNEMQV